MAFDFPTFPANGAVSNGYTWSAAANMWVGGPGVSGPVTEQYFDLSGKTQLDIAVPTWAKAAEFAGFVWNSTSTAADVSLRLSFDGTTFKAAATDYYLIGPQHFAKATTPYGTFVGQTAAQMYLLGATDSVVIPNNFEASINLVAGGTGGGTIDCRAFATNYSNVATVGGVTHWLHTWYNATAPGPVKALRLFSSIAMASGSWVRIRWLGDSAAIPATNAIADAPNDANVYLRGQNAWKSGGIIADDLTIAKALHTNQPWVQVTRNTNQESLADGDWGILGIVASSGGQANAFGASGTVIGTSGQAVTVPYTGTYLCSLNVYRQAGGGRLSLTGSRPNKVNPNGILFCHRDNQAAFSVTQHNTAYVELSAGDWIYYTVAMGVGPQTLYHAALHTCAFIRYLG